MPNHRSQATWAGQVSWRSQRTVHLSPSSVVVGRSRPNSATSSSCRATPRSGAGNGAPASTWRNPSRHISQPVAKLAAPARSSKEWVSANAVPPSVAVSSKVSRSPPQVNASRRGGSSSSTVPLAPSSPAKALNSIAPPTRRSISTGDGNQSPRCSGVVTARHTLSIGCG